MIARIAQLKAKLLASLRIDPKKSAVLAFLSVVLLVAVVRLLTGGARPAGALASLVQAVRPSAAARPAPSDKVAAAFSRWINEPQTNLNRNLFATRLEFFPSNNAGVKANDGGVNFWSQLGKSIAQATDEETKRENLVETLRLQAGQMRLQSTMAGPQPRAILNGKLVSEGGQIEGFRVCKIEARRVILERQGARFELSMK